MKKFTNHTTGPRGITVKGKDGKGSDTVWVEPGATVELDPKNVIDPLPDLGNGIKAEDASDDADLIAAVRAENADLKKQVADQSTQITKLTADLEKATKPAK